MCGICGLYYFDSQKHVERKHLQNMLSTIKHRGPDQEGMFFDKNMAFGIRRLKVIDLETGNQPIQDNSGRYTIVFNGEVYNFVELRDELKIHGYRFKTRSDTEVILYAYINWGLDFVNHLNGMFALAIWDNEERKIILARDRIGIKPLFFHYDHEKFAFGSEIKTILVVPEILREINIKALYYHFLLNYIPENLTLFNNIYHLPPGYLMVVSEHGIQKKKYWTIHFNYQEKIGGVESLKEEFISLFSDSVRLRLKSDVPLGVFLSGGLDSSSVAAMTVGLSYAPVKTFSVGFKESSFDESYYSSLVAKYLRTEHYEIIVDEDVVDVLPKLVKHMEEPTADSSAIPVYYLSEFTRKYVTVALSGDGADEMIAGYETYTADYLASIFSFIPGVFFQRLHKLVKLLPASYEKYALRQKLERFLRGVQYDLPVAHFTWRNIWDYDALSSLFARNFFDERILLEVIESFRSVFNCSGKNDVLTNALYADMVYYLPNDMLIKVDRMSMLHSLEVRVPFLDHRLVEFFFRLPPDLKLKWGFKKKFLLKEVMKSRLPKEIVFRKKSGFTVPIGKWFLSSLKEMTLDLFQSRMVKEMGIINQKSLLKVYEEHQKRKCNHDYMLWSVLIFLLWYQCFFEENVN